MLSLVDTVTVTTTTHMTAPGAALLRGALRTCLPCLHLGCCKGRRGGEVGAEVAVGGRVG